MGWVIAVDPGKNSGVAVLIDGKLSKVALVHNHDLAVHLDDLLMEEDEAQPPMSPPRDQVLVTVEVPQVYNFTKSKGNPNDLIKLAMTAGVAVALGDLWDCEIAEVKPYEWMGQLPKEVVQQRIKRMLNQEERSVIQRDLTTGESPPPKHLWHNVYDAIGIGLGQVGRSVKGGNNGG